MPTPNGKLAKALEALQAVQAGGRVAIRSRDLTRSVRELLVKRGFLQDVLKEWYIPTLPGSGPGETTAWYTSFWDFCRDYLNDRFGPDWSLTPEQSLVLQAGNFTVPRQLLVRAWGANNQATQFSHGTSVFEGAHTLPEPDGQAEVNGLRLFAPEAALVAAPASFFELYPTEARHHPVDSTRRVRRPGPAPARRPHRDRRSIGRRLSQYWPRS